MSDQLQFDARGRLFLLRREWDSEHHKRLWRRLQELGEPPIPTLLHEQADKTWSVEGLALKLGAEWFLVLNAGRLRSRRPVSQRVRREWPVLPGLDGGEARDSPCDRQAESWVGVHLQSKRQIARLGNRTGSCPGCGHIGSATAVVPTWGIRGPKGARTSASFLTVSQHHL